MGRQVLIRCNAGISFGQALPKIEQLLNVECELKTTSAGESHLFSCLGLDCAVYFSPVGQHVNDPRLEGYDVVINVGLYAIPAGKAHDEFDALFYIALFVAGVIARHLRWPSFVCSEESKILDEVPVPIV